MVSEQNERTDVKRKRIEVSETEAKEENTTANSIVGLERNTVQTEEKESTILTRTVCNTKDTITSDIKIEKLTDIEIPEIAKNSINDLQREQIRKQLAERLQSRISNKRTIVSDCLRVVLQKNTLLYIPSLPAMTVLVEAWEHITKANLIITESKKAFKQMEYRLSSVLFAEEILAPGKADSTGGKTLVLTLDELNENREKLLSAQFFSVPFTCIFENLTGRVSELSKHWIFRHATIVFGATMDPLVFSEFVKSAERPLDVYVHKTYLTNSYYKTVLDTAQVVCYESHTQDKRYETGLPAGAPVHTLVNYLIGAGLLFTGMFHPHELAQHGITPYVSPKLKTLLSALEKTRGFHTCIHVSSFIEYFVIYKMLMHSTSGQSCEPTVGLADVERLVQIDSNEVISRMPHVLKNRVLKSSGQSVDVQLISNLRVRHKAEPCNFIAFCFLPYLSKDHRVFVVSEEQRDALKRQVKADQCLVETMPVFQTEENVKKSRYVPFNVLENRTVIEAEVVNVNKSAILLDNRKRDVLLDNYNTNTLLDNRKRDVLLDNILLDNNNALLDNANTLLDKSSSKLNNIPLPWINTFTGRSYNFTVFRGELHEVQHRCTNRNFVLAVTKEAGKIKIHARCSVGLLSTCLNIHHCIKEPVVVPKIGISKRAFVAACEGFELCTVTSFKTMANNKTFPGTGYLVAFDKQVTVYFFSEERTLRFEFSAECFEDFIFMHLKRLTTHATVKHEGVEQGRSTGFEVIGEFLVFSFCLKTPPKIFTCAKTDELSAVLACSSPPAEKCDFFKRVEWKRLTLNEFPDFEESFDFRVSIPLFQDLSREVFSSLVAAARNTEDREAMTGLVRNWYLETAVCGFGHLPATLLATEPFRVTLPLSLKQFTGYFSSLDFSSFYALSCLVSRKGRLLLPWITQETVDFMLKKHLPSYCPALDKTLALRFEPVNFDIPCSGTQTSSDVLVRSVVLTPLRILFNYEMPFTTNRVLRNFDPDKFCRVSFRDELNTQKFSVDETSNTDGVYEFFRNVLLNGFTIGTRRYFFLVMTTSQLKVHGSWFVTPYEKEGVLIGSDYVKSWIGSFHSIKNIGKYAARIGLALSSATYTRDVHDFVEIEDTERNGYVFTDGIGLCTRGLAVQLCKDTGTETVPSAFQVRFGGYKGVVAVHPWLDKLPETRSELLEELLVSIEKSTGKTRNERTENNGMSDKTRNERTENNGMSDKTRNERTENNGMSDKKLTVSIPQLIMRKSMKKFDTPCRSLEIVNFAKCCDFFLNKQLVMMLEGLGVPKQVFVDYQNKYVYEMLVHMHNDYPSFVKKHAWLHKQTHTDLSFYRKMQAPILSLIFEEMNTKANVFIPQGRGAIGVVDELDVLEEDQVFLMFRKREDECMDSLVDYGSYAVPVGFCIVAKNPVMHPGDIRLVRCVDVPSLHYLREVVVFSKKGTRPLFNQCSGSDLDGDIFYVSWAKPLIPKATFKPYDYTDTNALAKERVLFSDIVNFYIRSMKHFQLGQIANAFFAIADRHSVFNPKALKLCEIFNKSIDYVKTGNLISVPDDLVPLEYPDFMERVPSYRSERALGLLYRRSLFDLSGLAFCECSVCTAKELQEQVRWKEFLLVGSGVRTREFTSKAPIDPQYTAILSSYKQDVLMLMDKHQLKSEEELFTRNSLVPEARSDAMQLIETYTALLKHMDSFQMASICSCGKFNALEVLCGDSYKLKKMVKKGTIKEGNSVFYFNSKIHLKSTHKNGDFLKNDLLVKAPCDTKNGDSCVEHPPVSLLTDELLVSFYSNSFTFKEITVLCDSGKITRFVNELDWKKKELFKEFFNLLLLAGVYKLDQLDQLFDYLIALNREMKESTVPDLLRVAFPGSNDVVFKILTLIPLDLALHKKCVLLRERSTCFYGGPYRASRICKRVCIVISGMLDENDDFVFVRKGNKLVPELRNKGTCSVDYYKDTLRDFLVNLLWSHENAVYLKTFEGPADCTPCSPRVVYQLFFTSGEFFFTKVPVSQINDRISVKFLEKTLGVKENEEKYDHTFVNTHECLDSSKRIDFLAKIKPITGNRTREVLSFVFEGFRFTIEYIDGELCSVSKNKRILGRAFILNNGERNDLNVELYRKEVTYSKEREIDWLDDKERFMLEKKLFVVEETKYRFNLNKEQLSLLSKVKFEKMVEYSNVDGFTMVNTSAYSLVGDLFVQKNERFGCFIVKEFSFDKLEQFNFDCIYGKLWRMYNQIL